jgi:hypothetical protein
MQLCHDKSNTVRIILESDLNLSARIAPMRQSVPTMYVTFRIEILMMTAIIRINQAEAVSRNSLCFRGPIQYSITYFHTQ